MNFPFPPRHACALAVIALAPAVAPAQPGSLTLADSARACPATPSYPPAALRNLASGRNLVRVTADSAGDVVEAHLLRPSGVLRENSLLDNAAVEAARRCHYAAIGPSGATRRGVVLYEWRIEGLADSNPYNTGSLAVLQRMAAEGDASAGYWLYLRSDATPDAAAPADALRWLAFAASHGMEKAQSELDRLHALDEDAGLERSPAPATK